MHVTNSGFGGAERPQVFGSVAQLDTRGKLTGQETHWIKAEDAGDDMQYMNDNSDGL